MAGNLDVSQFMPVGGSASCKSLAVTSASQTLTLPTSTGPGGTMKVYVSGGQDVAWSYGSTVSFPVTGGAAGGDVLQAGTTQCFDLPGGVTTASFIAGASGSTVYVTVGRGQ